MEASDLFRKLMVGTKFDLKRFKKDAERFKLLKPHQVTSDEVVHYHDSKTMVDDINGIDHNENTSQHSSGDDLSESEADDPELNLLGDITSQSKLKQRERKKGNKNKKSKEKLYNLKIEKINQFRNANKINVVGTDIPKPLESFEELKATYNISESLFQNICNEKYLKPTPIQMQAIPAILEGREILACAPTGSGKTAAFLIPIIHKLKQPRKSGYRAVILAPTRELARQIYQECTRLSEGTHLRIHSINKGSQAAKSFGLDGPKKYDILITTPNRLVYLLNQEPKVLSLSNVEFLVIDEADKLFEAGKQGFRDQLAVIYQACDSSNIRRAMFSATYTHDVELWCKLNLDNVITVSVGVRNSAVNLVKQEVLFVGEESGKLLAFRDLVLKGKLEPPVLVFVQTKDRAKELFSELIYDGINVDVIHAERSQQQRDNVVKSFRSGKIWVLICTEIMGRGIDFKGVNLVINYDFPTTAISYIHRIGRTGRAGRPGKAITFFTEDDSRNLRSIAQVMKNAGCKVPSYMLKLKKQTKSEKKQLAKNAPKRKSISTEPLYDKMKKKRKMEAKFSSRKNKNES